MKRVTELTHALLPILALTTLLCIFTLAILPDTACAWIDVNRTIERELVMNDDDPDQPYPLTSGDRFAEEVETNIFTISNLTSIIRIVETIF